MAGQRILDGISYGKSMKVLERAKKVHINNEWKLIRLTVKDSEILTELGLIPKIITVKNPRDRPPKDNLPHRARSAKTLYCLETWSDATTYLETHS